MNYFYLFVQLILLPYRMARSVVGLRPVFWNWHPIKAPGYGCFNQTGSGLGGVHHLSGRLIWNHCVRLAFGQNWPKMEHPMDGPPQLGNTIYLCN